MCHRLLFRVDTKDSSCLRNGVENQVTARSKRNCRGASTRAPSFIEKFLDSLRPSNIKLDGKTINPRIHLKIRGALKRWLHIFFLKAYNNRTLRFWRNERFGVHDNYRRLRRLTSCELNSEVQKLKIEVRSQSNPRVSFCHYLPNIIRENYNNIEVKLFKSEF